MRAAPLAAAAALTVACALGGCAGAARQPAHSVQGSALAAAATELVGTPYHFGGADSSGFDCSGLALYVHARVGLAIPRTAAEQRRAARPVAIAELAPGDLVFFHIRKRSVDHVGIYAGGGRFVHAPRAGAAVTYGDLRSGFYATHVVGAGRFWDAAAPAR